MPQIDFNLFLPTAYWYSLGFLFFAICFYVLYLAPYITLIKLLNVFQIFLLGTAFQNNHANHQNQLISINFGTWRFPVTHY